MAASAKPGKGKPRPARAVGETEQFEATCPTCGMTADVPAGVAELRCRSCGTPIRLVDHPVAAPAPAAAAVPVPPFQAEPPAGAVRQPVAALLVGSLAPLLVGFAFLVAHTALDQPEPDTGTAGFWFMASLVLATGAVASQWPILGPPVGTRAPWGILIGIPAFIVILMAGQSYDDDGVAWVILGLPMLGIYLLAVGIAAAVMSNRRDGAGAGAVLVSGVGICMAFGVAAIYMLLSLQDQAAEARAAHEAPAWGFVLAIGTLLALAARRRRISP